MNSVAQHRLFTEEGVTVEPVITVRGLRTALAITSCTRIWI